MILLTTNTKLDKTNSDSESKFVVKTLQLAPHKVAGKNSICPDSTPGCRRSCIYLAGHGRFAKTQSARMLRTQMYHKYPSSFLYKLDDELNKFEKSANKKGKSPCVRLNCYSDIPWETLTVRDNKNIFDLHPKIQFYDYTKSKQRMLNFIDGQLPSNYYLVFSRSEANESECKEILERGGNVAAVFQEVPSTWLDAKVVDGDSSDLRFLEGKQGIVIGLYEKGIGKQDPTGFVIR